MRTFSSLDLLNAWEHGLGRSTAERAVTLLSMTLGSEDSSLDLGRLPLGQRDARLFDLRESAFGSQMEAVASCPQCRVEQEFHVHTSELRPPSPATEVLALASGDYQVEFRLPDSIDICEAALEASSESEIELRLLQRCLTSATARERPVSAADLPSSVIREISERMSQADPHAEIDLSLQCPACSHRWQERFDIASFLWSEVHAWAERTLSDVHQLAAAYGWSEKEILSLSSRRRSVYLELITA
jgi:hypothetical protein